MSEQRPHLKTPEEIERTGVAGLVGVLRTEGIDGVRYAPWYTTGWHRDYAPCVWRGRATDEQKRVGRGMWVRMERTVATVLREAHERQGRGSDGRPRGGAGELLWEQCRPVGDFSGPHRNDDRE